MIVFVFFRRLLPASILLSKHSNGRHVLVSADHLWNLTLLYMQNGQTVLEINQIQYEMYQQKRICFGSDFCVVTEDFLPQIQHSKFSRLKTRTTRALQHASSIKQYTPIKDNSPTNFTFRPTLSLFRQVGSLFRQVGSLIRQYLRPQVSCSPLESQRSDSTALSLPFSSAKFKIAFFPCTEGTQSCNGLHRHYKFC